MNNAKTALQQDCAQRVEAAVEEYMSTGRPSIESMFDYMYAEIPHDLEVQKAAALKESK